MLIVKKFGGSSVADKECIFRVAERCAEDYKSGHDVIVVLSAMGDTTDDLIAKAKEINPNPSRRELDTVSYTHLDVYKRQLEDGNVHTLEETGQILGVTRERIRQLESRALEKLRKSAGPRA